jgi:HCOMODA/2-hydroxy-3-carboxy-muconic semialdehyde decarboxylase
MSRLGVMLEELVTANRILAREGVVDSFGHVTMRHPNHPDRFIMSRARAPDCIEVSDFITFTLDGNPLDAGGRELYAERFIHGACYEARPDVHSVVHNHSPSVIPFGVTGCKLRPLLHVCGSMGHNVGVWDSQDKFGDTNLLVSNMEMGRDLARFLGKDRAALMRGHGAVVVSDSLRRAVFISVYVELGAKLQMQAMAMGEVKYLTDGEIDIIIKRSGPAGINRAWENWCRRAGRSMQDVD